MTLLFSVDWVNERREASDVGRIEDWAMKA
jgi:hypothetical protein